MNKHIARYLKKYRKSDSEIWSDNRMLRGTYLSSKTMQRVRQGD